MGADLFVFTEQWGFPVKACSLPSHAYLRDHWRSGVTMLWPQRPEVSHRFLPGATSALLCSRRPSLRLSRSDASRVQGAPAQRWDVQLTPGVRGAGDIFRQTSSGVSSPQNRWAVEILLLPYTNPQQLPLHSARAHLVELRLFSEFNQY